MAVASMSAFPPPPPALGVFAPPTPLVVKRDKRRRRRQPSAADEASERDAKRRAVRQGFVFDSTPHDDAERSTASSAPSTFAFRVRKPSPTAVDAAQASEALARKQERAKKRQRLEKRRRQAEKEEALEAALRERGALSSDQLALFAAVCDQVKREMRKTMRDFARSAARADILELTEKSLEAIKSGMAEFLQANPPSQTMETVANPENARLQAVVESYEARIKELEKEEAEWTKMKDSILAENHTSSGEPERKEVELSVTTEIGNLQRAVISEVESSAERLQVIQDSMASIDRLALQAEIKKSKLFDAFHGSAFKGYAKDPKETLRSLLKLAPPRPSN